MLFPALFHCQSVNSSLVFELSQATAKLWDPPLRFAPWLNSKLVSEDDLNVQHPTSHPGFRGKKPRALGWEEPVCFNRSLIWMIKSQNSDVHCEAHLPCIILVFQGCGILFCAVIDISSYENLEILI